MRTLTMDPRTYGIIREGTEAHQGVSEIRQVANEQDIREEARASFDASQGLLAQLITMSSLLLGFIVTGSMLSVAMTGDQNYSITELLDFMRWSGVAALCAVVALTLGFLTSVRSTYVMETRGIVMAQQQITKGGRCKTSLAELLIYGSLMFFMLSMRQFLSMVYTGPNFCPSYEGSASRCGMLGKAFYDAAALQCSSKYGSAPCVNPPACSGTSPKFDCLCHQWCSKDWTANSTLVSAQLNAVQWHWFGYYHGETDITRQERWQIVNDASALACKLTNIEQAYEQCANNTQPSESYTCSGAFSAWQKASECVDGKQQQADECGKVCAWTGSTPPHVAVHRVQDYGIIPVVVLLSMVIGCRVFVLLFRLARSCQDIEDLKENTGIADIERQLQEDCPALFAQDVDEDWATPRDDKP